MSALDELIARLEKATGPDRELDCAIGAWVCREVTGLLARIYSDAESAPHYSSSIDSALTLVPEGLHWACAPAWEAREHRVYRPYRGVNEWIESIGEHKHDAIALCIAALKARNAIASPVVTAAPCPPTGEARDGGNQ